MVALTPAIAGAQQQPGKGERDKGVTRIEQAREESGIERHPATAFALPAGILDLSASTLLATAHQTLRFTVTLGRAVSDGRLTLTLPARWAADSGVSGLPFARVPGGDRELDLAFGGGQSGDTKSVEVTDNGIPGGTYSIPFRWTEADGTSASGTATVIFLNPVRESADETGGSAWSRLTAPGLEVNGTNDASTESETFSTVVPGNPLRFVLGANGGGGFNAWITNDGGTSFSKAPMSTSIDQPGTATVETGVLCCDPMSAADPAGNIWYGGLSFNNGGANPSRIVVARAAAPSAVVLGPTVGLPFAPGGTAAATQDKPMMTIDNTASSPTFGRLYVVWDVPIVGGDRVALTQCDTRPSAVANAANCDNADNWTTPVYVTPATGGYIYADVAVGPDGKVYVTWWDYSATNAIRGDVCASACDNQASWGPNVKTIATLDATGGTALPFACPILAQPGGRASTGPNVEVDHSGG
ncbi:MAG: hypothetical protein QOG68_1831, partial [Solirubrobacteraceae bacterium]|nr:hypothetical protein [Solirubrobacteraceae bacterium]